jgi:hypothetical protein
VSVVATAVAPRVKQFAPQQFAPQQFAPSADPDIEERLRPNESSF